MRLSSGDHAGSHSESVLSVKFTKSDPSGFITETFHVPPRGCGETKTMPLARTAPSPSHAASRSQGWHGMIHSPTSRGPRARLPVGDFALEDRGSETGHCSCGTWHWCKGPKRRNT